MYCNVRHLKPDIADRIGGMPAGSLHVKRGADMLFKKKKEVIKEKTWEEKVRSGELSPVEGAKEAIRLISKDISQLHASFYDSLLNSPAPTEEARNENEGAVAHAYEYIWKCHAMADTFLILYIDDLFQNIYTVPGVLEDVSGEKNVTIKMLFDIAVKKVGKYEDLILKCPKAGLGKYPYSEEFFDMVLDTIMSFKDRYEPLLAVMRDEKAGKLAKKRAEDKAVDIYYECLDTFYKKIGYDIATYKKVYPDIIKRKLYV